MVQYISEPFEDADERGYFGPGWYFWDEAQVNCYGPYPDRETAEYAATDYANHI